MPLTEGAPNVMQRLARLPTAHMSIRCSVESLSRFPYAINTTLENEFISDGVAPTG
jgi:hypothetical protein